MRNTLATLLSVVTLLGSTALHSAEQTLDSIIAVVNDDIILATDFENERARLLRQPTPNMPKGEDLDRAVFERLIVQSLQLQQARQRGIRVDDSNLQRTLEDMARNNSMSLNQLRETLSRDGVDFLEFRESIRREMIISTLMRREVESNLRISDEEVDDYLRSTSGADNNSYELEHILVKLPQQADTAQVESAQRIARQIASAARDGQSFSAIVDAQRATQGDRVEGGNLGWRTPVDLPDLFVGQLPAMQIGDVTEPLRSPAGFHVLKLLNQRSKDTREVSRVRARHILISTRENRSVAQAEQEITQLRALLAEGRTFDSLAKDFSDDKNTAPQGGDLGWFSAGEMVPVFERKAFSAPVNEVSQPFQTQFGWHLLEVLEREYAQQQGDQDAAERARQQLRQTRAEEQFQEWLQRLRDSAYVELRGFGKNFQ
jgi:peptidyl-prolyl cis-trans isomerase SurA